MNSKTLRGITMILLATVVLGTVAEAQSRRGGGMVSQQGYRAQLGEPGQDSGWADLSVIIGRHQLQTTTQIQGGVYDLVPQNRYRLQVNGIDVASFVSNEMGDATIAADVSMLDLEKGGAGGFANPARVNLVDNNGMTILTGILAKSDDALKHSVYMERIELEDVLTMGAEGHAAVARFDTDVQVFRGTATGLEPQAEYRVYVDGYLAKTGFTDELGRGRVTLVSDCIDHPLPPEMQPIEAIRIVEVVDAIGQTVLAGAFTGDPDNTVVMSGVIDSIGVESFDLLHDGQLVTILVGEDTTFAGGLESFEDLQPELHVGVYGEWTSEASIEALVIGSRNHPRPIHISAEVTEIGSDFFKITVGEEQARVAVDEETRWLGDLDGIEDLEIGMPVRITGYWLEDGALQAMAVAWMNRPEPVRFNGEINDLLNSGFVITDEEGQTIEILVDAATHWLGGLQGLDDLSVGMTIQGAGFFQEDGSFMARAVAPWNDIRPVTLAGEIVDIDSVGFTVLTGGGDSVSVVVNEDTEWLGGLADFSDLEIGMKVAVRGWSDEEEVVIAILVTLDPRTEALRLTGIVADVFVDGFTLDQDGVTDTIFVDEKTQWKGGLFGLDDLHTDMPLLVAAIGREDESLLAISVAAWRPETVQVSGAIVDVSPSAFTLDHDGSLIDVRVGEDTVWRGQLDGIEDLEPGILVFVRGVFEDEATLNAIMVRAH